jgi:hypothetical protein
LGGASKSHYVLGPISLPVHKGSWREDRPERIERDDFMLLTVILGLEKRLELRFNDVSQKL